MPWGAAVTAAAAIGGSLISANATSNASKGAADAQVASTQAADQTQLQMFNQTQTNLQPWMTSGGNALTALNSYEGVNANGTINPNAPGQTPFSYTPSAGLNASIQAGDQSVLNNASAVGGVNSGNTLRALQSVGQGATYQDYWNQYNAQTAAKQQQYQNLYNLSSSGQNAAASLGGFGSNAANQISANQIGAGSAQASGIVGAGNALSGAINNASPYLLSYLQQQRGGGASSYNYGGANNYYSGSGATLGGTSDGGYQV